MRIHLLIAIISLPGLLAVRTGAGDFDDGEFWHKARGARRGRKALCHRRGRNLADGTTALADQECHQGSHVMTGPTPKPDDEPEDQDTETPKEDQPAPKEEPTPA